MSTVLDARYRIAIIEEEISIFWMILLVKLGLRKLTIEERCNLKQRKEWIHKRVEELKL